MSLQCTVYTGSSHLSMLMPINAIVTLFTSREVPALITYYNKGQGCVHLYAFLASKVLSVTSVWTRTGSNLPSTSYAQLLLGKWQKDQQLRCTTVITSIKLFIRFYLCMSLLRLLFCQLLLRIQGNWPSVSAACSLQWPQRLALMLCNDLVSIQLVALSAAHH